MLNLKKTLIFTLVLVSSFSVFAADKAKAGKERVLGTVGGAGADSRGLKDTLPITIEYGKPSSGITLQPPQLNDNPAATLVVETSGNSKLALEIIMYKCAVDENGAALRRSCNREFSGSTNSPIKVLPGHYLITGATNSDNKVTTIYNEKPIYIRAGENRQLAMKPIQISPTERLLNAYIGVDYSNRDELRKLMGFEWATKGESGFLMPSFEFSCESNKNSKDKSCDYKTEPSYYSSSGPSIYSYTHDLKDLARALCFESEKVVSDKIARYRFEYSKYPGLYEGAGESLDAVIQAFKEERLFDSFCGKKEFLEDHFSKTVVSKGIDERIHYEQNTIGKSLFNFESDQTSLKLFYDKNTKKTNWSVTQIRNNFPDFYVSSFNNFVGQTNISLNKERTASAAAYVFPGTYTVTYRFVGNWNNTDKTLTQTQYGHVVE